MMVVKNTVSTNIVENYANKADQQVKWQEKEIENLKAVSMQLDPKKMKEAMTQAIACMYNTQKGPIHISGTKPTGGKPYLEKSKPSEITKGLDSITSPTNMCEYWKDTGHELDNCRKLQ